jgi:hypothetical protein
MVNLSNHKGLARAVVRRFTVRQAHHEAFSAFPVSLLGAAISAPWWFSLQHSS